ASLYGGRAAAAVGDGSLSHFGSRPRRPAESPEQISRRPRGVRPMNLLSPRTVQRAERVVDMPSRPEQVPPGLRFMLRPEALEEAWAFWKWLDSVVFDMMTDQHRKAFFESQVVATLPSKYPLLAMADRAVGGEFTKA